MPASSCPFLEDRNCKPFLACFSSKICVFWAPVTIYNDFSGSNWLHHEYVTLDGCHMHLNKQKELKVMLEPKRSCTILPAPHCIKQLDKHPARSGSAPEVYNFWHRHTYVALVCWQWIWISISYWRLHLLLLLLVGGVVNWKAPDNDSLHTFSYIIYLIEMN